MKPTTTINSITLFILCVCLSVPAVSQQSVTDSLSFYRTIVDSPQDAEDLVKANQFFEKHSREAKAAGDFVIAAHDDFQLARIYYRGGFYDESETLAVKVLELLDTMPQDAYILDFKKSVYNHLGMLYRENYHEPRAIKMYKNALSLAPNASDSAIVYNNISNVYKDIEKYDIAKTELLHAYDLLPRIKDTLREALIVDNMGYLNFKLKDTSALSFFNTALKLRLKVNDTLSTFSSYQNLSEYYKAQDTGKAMGYALRAYDLSDIIKNPFYKEKALRLLADLNANRYYDAYINFRDSIDNAQKKAVNKFASLKYDVSKSELMAEREKSKRIRYQIIFLIALSISLLAIVWIRAVAKKKRLLQVYNTETRISKKVHDEIANDVYQVMSYIQTTSKPNEALLDDLETIYNKTRDI